jgi:hypothetical protein
MVGLFNEWIDRWALIEIKDPTRNFTRSNNQRVPILATPDRILVSTHWDAKYPLAKTSMLPKGVIDHNPLMITFGEKSGIPIFRFEKWWMEIEVFENLVKETWSRECPCSDPVDRW